MQKIAASNSEIRKAIKLHHTSQFVLANSLKIMWFGFLSREHIR
jgi:hypothetical protein